MTMSRSYCDVGLFAFAPADPDAKTAAASANVTATGTKILGFMAFSSVRFRQRRYHPSARAPSLPFAVSAEIGAKICGRVESRRPLATLETAPASPAHNPSPATKKTKQSGRVA
jgi:hypothetical protein